jgi:uracil-DNA glycosylase family 4
MYLEWTYWGRPVPGFGDPAARLLILGIAPAAHGANRTGRIFTGDRSGDFLFAALHRAGFANQSESRSRDDGLRLTGCYISATVRCCPPANMPRPDEKTNCRPYLEEELRLLEHLRAILALGQIAHNACLHLLKEYGRIGTIAAYPFAHGAHFVVPADARRGDTRSSRYGAVGHTGKTIHLFDSYHPSQQNTQTGRLTPAMFDRVLRAIEETISTPSLSSP